MFEEYRNIKFKANTELLILLNQKALVYAKQILINESYNQITFKKIAKTPNFFPTEKCYKNSSAIDFL